MTWLGPVVGPLMVDENEDVNSRSEPTRFPVDHSQSTRVDGVGCARSIADVVEGGEAFRRVSSVACQRPSVKGRADGDDLLVHWRSCVHATRRVRSKDDGRACVRLRCRACVLCAFECVEIQDAMRLHLRTHVGVAREARGEVV
jgi:hypothetical protein